MLRLNATCRFSNPAHLAFRYECCETLPIRRTPAILSLSVVEDAFTPFPTRDAAIIAGATLKEHYERGPIFRTGKLMILYQLTRSFHETYSPSYFSRRV